MTLESGLAAAFRHTVTEADSAAAIGSGEVPVLATPRVLALAEQATVAAVAGALQAGATTVGTRDAGRRAGPWPGADRVRRAQLDGDDLGRNPGGAGLSGAGGDSLAGRGWGRGLFERLFAPRVLRRLYAEELERLDRYARTVPPG